MRIFSLTSILVAVAWLALSPSAMAEAPSASELLKAVDRNLQFDTRTSTATMRVETGRRSRSYEMVTYARGKEDAAVEYLAPERDKGTRMLKRGGNLWIYLPSSERVQKISGHMLRQGLMGSDISYEDLLDAADFEKNYRAEIAGEDVIDGRPQWKIEALARNPSVTYPKRLMWIDKEWLIPSRQELFALSGMKLKTWTMSEVKVLEGRRIPMHTEVADVLRQGSKTILDTKELALGVALKEEVFSLRWIERK
jgi:outer membrane lipoprotein-sorting protein